MKKKFLILGLSLLFNGAIFGISSTSPSSQDFSEIQNVKRRQSHCNKHHKNTSKSCCCRGPRGHTGQTGATGPTGATGLSLTNFISLYTLNSDGEQVAIGDAVPFDHISTNEGSITSTSTTTITITEAGTYNVTFGIATIGFSDVRANLQSFTLEKNGVAVPGGTYNNALTAGLSGLTIDIVITPIDVMRSPGATLQVIYTFGVLNPSQIQVGEFGASNDPAATTAFIEVHQIL